jgi:hypothetical protein
MYVTTNESNICEALYLQELTLAELTKEVSRALDLTVRQWSYFLCIKAYINYDRQTESQQSFITIFYLLNFFTNFFSTILWDRVENYYHTSRFSVYSCKLSWSLLMLFGLGWHRSLFISVYIINWIDKNIIHLFWYWKIDNNIWKCWSLSRPSNHFIILQVSKLNICKVLF